MSDRDKRGERLASRLEDEPEAEESTEVSGTAKSEERSKTEKTVKSRTNVNMYLPDGLVDELQIRFDELNAQYRREHGEAMEKNRDYYPAVVKAGLEGKELKEILDIKEE